MSKGSPVKLNYYICIMACTALKIEKDGVVTRVKFMTVPFPDHVDVDVYNCNEFFIPVDTPAMGHCEGTEEEYHKKLRLQASEKNQYVPEESTDRHWDPGYVEPEDENQDQVQ
jgi:hypothetical protein